jgi:hypothetical protein
MSKTVSYAQWSLQPYCIGLKLRSLRSGKRLTLSRLAAETGAVVYVLEGRLRLDAGGLHDVLESGDCACMESEIPLAWSAADKHRCRVLAVLPSAKQTAEA